MAITSQGSFVATSNKIAATTLTFTSSIDIEAGQSAVLVVGVDNLTTLTSSNNVLRVTDNAINYNFQQGTGFNSTAYSVVTQSDGKVLVGGAFTTYNGQDAPYVARLNTDGTLDTGFNSNYKNINGIVYKLVVQPDVIGSCYSPGSWIETSPLINARARLGSAGMQNNAIVFGGVDSAATSIANTEQFDGYVWTEVTALNISRNGLAGVGFVNAALAFGGTNTAGTQLTCTEEYNGTTWTNQGATGAMITARQNHAGAGIQNAALSFGGQDVPTGNVLTCTEEYNGTSWSSGGALNTARQYFAGTGTQNAALAAGGQDELFNDVSCTEEYNGTTWSVGGDLITPMSLLSGVGIQNDALVFGGFVSPASNTEAYNGTSWSARNSTNLSRSGGQGAGVGTQNLALYAGGGVFNSADTYTEAYISVESTCISDKIVVVGAFTKNAIRLNLDGNIDPSFTINPGFNNTVCTVLLQQTDAYVGGGVWSAGGALINNSFTLSGAGTQNEALAIGGVSIDGRCTEEYNGTSWSAGGDLIVCRYASAAAGTQNSAIVFGGFVGASVSNCTQTYNGTTWTSGVNLITARIGLAGAGTQNSTLAISGNDGSIAIANTEEFNGSVWSTGGNLITARYYLGGVGIQNAALAFNGLDGIPLTCTEEYNGTSWSSQNASTSQVYAVGGAGIQNSALSFGGYDGRVASNYFGFTEKYNGSTWVSRSPLITRRSDLAGAGNSADAALAFGGITPTSVTCTEEFNTYTTNYCNKLIFGGTFTTYNNSVYCGSIRLDASADIDTTFKIGSGFTGSVDVRCLQFYCGNNIWSVGGALITARFRLASTGTQNEALTFGGFSFPLTLSCTEEYDGSSWSAGGALITARSGLAGAGTQNAALGFGSPTCTEEYNGTSWSTGGDLISARTWLAGAGTQNQALAFGGSSGASPVSVCTCTEEYNGTSWTDVTGLIYGRNFLAGAGTQNAALAFGGFAISPSVQQSAFTEEYDGTTWTAGGDLITARYTLAGAGTQNAALAVSGVCTSTIVSCTEEYDGTTWSSAAAVITGREQLSGAGTQNSALTSGGGTGGGITNTCTEEYSTPIYLISVGNFTGYSGSLRSRIALINADDGTLIPTSSFNIGAGFNAVVNSIAVQSDNKILATGNFTTYSGSGATRIARINTTGLIDTGSIFNTGVGLNASGSVIKSYISASTELIVVGGAFTSYSGSGYSGFVRILNNGSRDTTLVTSSGFTAQVDVEDIIVEQDVNNGFIVVGGFTVYSGAFSPSPNRIVKLNANGSIDATSTGNTWIKLSERGTGDAAAAGSAVAMFYISPSSTIYAGTTITASLSGSITSKAATGWVFGTTSSILPVSGAVSSSLIGGTSALPPMTLTGSLTGSGDYLFVRGIALEVDTFTYTPTPNFTTMSAAGTTGGAAITNISVRTEFRVLSTRSLLSTPTSSLATSNANVYYLFYEVPQAIVSGGKTYFLIID